MLHEDEPPALEVINAQASSRLLLVCDHASPAVPRRLENLGITEEQLTDHIGWDSGAADVARNLSARLQAPLVLTNYSRLVIDCNRPLENKDSIPVQSDGIAIPGNANLTPEQRIERQSQLFHPYHRAIETLLDERLAKNPVMLSIHSFTPMLEGKPRPWSAGVCYGTDRRLADLLLAVLRKTRDSSIGDNQPYAIEADVDYTLPRHAETRRLPHAMLEISKDQLRTPISIERWAIRLALAWKEVQPLLP